MNRFLAGSIALICGAVGLLAGCDNPPDPIRTPEGKPVEAISVQAADPAEVAAVTAAEAARADYKYRLGVLRDYYFKVGNLDKMNEAENERKNLDQAQYFRFLGVEVTAPPGQSLANADERLLVEETLAARAGWLACLDKLDEYYRGKNETFKARLVQNVKQRFGPIQRYTYFPEAEVPGPQLRPTEVIPAADELFARAHKLFQDGKGELHFFVTTKYSKERDAAALFRELIQRYPTSTKIALAAYYIADIYKEYFNEDVRAIRWYERAWQWDPHVTEPARFQAATVYDLRLLQKPEAIECYRGALEYEQFNKSNCDFARKRLRDLEQ
jgi:TolA-binding protein